MGSEMCIRDRFQGMGRSFWVERVLVRNADEKGPENNKKSESLVDAFFRGSAPASLYPRPLDV